MALDDLSEDLKDLVSQEVLIAHEGLQVRQRQDLAQLSKAVRTDLIKRNV